MLLCIFQYSAGESRTGWVQTFPGHWFLPRRRCKQPPWDYACLCESSL